ncbi:ANTAR domain-containing response regulator [Anaerotalea alkaliphila]|uniref:Stage 0 sporulation protein A homolog n=1 Tax=Anaerotalea alkaliphila TaxID=2662126 RepID=A0A7X5HW59_9FIRM|nr:response regulator [Anaerotalea alkaliphila]NDL67750.1 response regulator [Anaerotalea alkaliphila]
MGVRVLIGSSNQKILKQLAQFLAENGMSVMGETADGFDLLRRANTIYPDVVVVDYNIKGINGHEVSELLVGDKTCPVIALVAELELAAFVNLNQDPLFVPLVKPCGKQALVNTIHLLSKTSKSIRDLEDQVQDMRKEKDSKQLLAKAKKLLMEHMEMTEEEAHRRIQKQSMDKGLAKVKIAEAIILMYE